MTFLMRMTLEWSPILVAAPIPGCGLDVSGHDSSPGVGKARESQEGSSRTLDTAPAPDEPADRVLVAAARGGNRSAFAALVARHHEPLLRRLRRQTGDSDLAADLAQ